jgi:osmotically-inducible protein OsmY
MRASTIHSSPVDLLKLEETATACLHASSYLAVRRLWCELEKGILFLRGSLDSFYLKQVAQEAVVRIKGTARLVNEIVVARAAGSQGGREVPERWAGGKPESCTERRSEPC